MTSVEEELLANSVFAEVLYLPIIDVSLGIHQQSNWMGNASSELAQKDSSGGQKQFSLFAFELIINKATFVNWTIGNNHSSMKPLIIQPFPLEVAPVSPVHTSFTVSLAM